jgi:hypothetical protein
MKSRTPGIWALLFFLALICIVLPPRRDTFDGRDTGSIPSRVFLWSSDLYQGSESGSRLQARIDCEKLGLELLALGTLGTASAFLVWWKGDK